jgi:hypothetical protein
MLAYRLLSLSDDTEPRIMNEVELIRAQLSLERQHAAAVSHALSAAAAQGEKRLAPLGAFREASVDYLAWILSRFEEREQVFHELVRSRFAAQEPLRNTLEAAFARSGTSREALVKLESALRPAEPAGQSGPRWAEFLLFFDGAWSERRDALDELFVQHAKVTDWRAVSGIDADSIFDERNRYARVRAALPQNIELPATSSRV